MMGTNQIKLSNQAVREMVQDFIDRTIEGKHAVTEVRHDGYPCGLMVTFEPVEDSSKQDEVARLEKLLADERGKATLLRDALNFWLDYEGHFLDDEFGPICRQAIKATDPKGSI